MSVNLLHQVAYAASELALPSLMHGPVSCEDLFDRVKSHCDSLSRLMRGMAHFGLCIDHGNHVFELTESGRRLQQFGSGNRSADRMQHRTPRQGSGMLLYSVRTGQPAFERAFGMPFFEYTRMHPEAADRFGSLMAADTASRAAAIAMAYDYDQATTIVDVGGGHGVLIAEILKHNPSLSGILFDVDTVIRRAESRGNAAGRDMRHQLMVGDFFEWVPPGHDLYLYSQVLHDWGDEECRRILSVCHRAVNPGGKVLVIEALMPERIEIDTPVVELDLMMMMLTGGKERTHEEYRELLVDTGFQLESAIPVDADFTILEGSPATGFARRA